MSSELIRTLFVSHSLSTGGAERFASTVSSGLDRRRFEPILCLAVNKVSYPVADDIEVVDLGYRGLISLPRTVARLRDVVRRLRPHVVLSNVISTNCLTGSAIRASGVKTRWIARVGMAPRVGEPLLQRWWARLTYPLADSFVLNSRNMVDSFVETYPGTRARCRHIPNPVDFSRLDKLAEAPIEGRLLESPDSPRILFVGRLTEQKRLDVLLEAFGRIAERCDARLWLCGDGPLRRQVKEAISAAELDHRVEMLGFRENPFALMRRADLFALTSDFEGLPNALIEAQGLGLPAVSTRCPTGPEEIIEDGVTGRLVEVGAADEVAAAMAEILGNRMLMAKMAAAARRRARSEYSSDTILPQWECMLAGD